MDCVSKALIALKLIGITLPTIPALVVEPTHGRAAYQPNVVYLSDPARCDYLVHEYVHHKQYTVHGYIPETHGEYMKWEFDAENAKMHAVAAYLEEFKRGINE